MADTDCPKPEPWFRFTRARVVNRMKLATPEPLDDGEDGPTHVPDPTPDGIGLEIPA
jgi:hypothetical protein